jgi:hypothetical protein
MWTGEFISELIESLKSKYHIKPPARPSGVRLTPVPTSETSFRCRHVDGEEICSFYQATWLGEASKTPAPVQPCHCAHHCQPRIGTDLCASTDTKLTTTTGDGAASAQPIVSDGTGAVSADELPFDTVPDDYYAMETGVTAPSSVPVYMLSAHQRAKQGIRAISPAGGGDVVFVRQRRTRPGGAFDFEDEEYLAALDSGANRYLVNQYVQKFLLRNQRPANLSMRSATGAVTQITEQGDIELRAVDNVGNELAPLILNDVSVLKGSPLNLLSVSALCERGSSFHFS